MKDDYDLKQSELAVAVAAAAYSIQSLEEAEIRKNVRQELELPSSARLTRGLSSKDQKGGEIRKNVRQELELPSSARLTRGLSSKDQKEGGETSARDLARLELRRHESAMSFGERNQKQQARQTRVDAWEEEQVGKINTGYEKIRSSILAWENEKKMQAKLKMERKTSKLEHKRAVNRQHYQNKIARIERIAREAQAEVEEERRNKEYEIKQKAKMIGSKGKFPVRCFCW
ncbi:remorin 1.4-like [Mangifera indica]|uniref:remorin 1.4-like n=1 Tax=Mangifera indica TaxID=29780 RepID=UPI001CFB7183|nr:remorin 1.4-like [Mangifera indica]